VVVEFVPAALGVVVVGGPTGDVPGVDVGGAVVGVEVCPAGDCPAGAEDEPAGELWATAQPAQPSTSDSIAMWSFMKTSQS
jgi:hypothetical protein